MTAQHRGLTWDHPRGRDALEAAARVFQSETGEGLTWAAHSLEGFESAPIADLASEYDLIVLDHPHLGDALAADCLVPLDELFAAAELDGWAERAVGPSFRSYVLDGRPWGLPLDAATQVSARRPDLVPAAPETWEAVLELTRSGLVAPSLAGPHAFLSWCSIVVGWGEEPFDEPGRVCSPEVALAAIDLLTLLDRAAPDGCRGLNPIGLLERLTSGDDLGYVPLIYGYSTYAATGRPRAAVFGPPPSGPARTGSTIGGTGLVITRRCRPTPALLDHLRWLLGDRAQSGHIPQHGGQPAMRAAWQDPDVNAATGGFFERTLVTIDDAWVRPRFAGYVPLQTHASALIRAAVAGEIPRDDVVSGLDALFSGAYDALRAHEQKGAPR